MEISLAGTLKEASILDSVDLLYIMSLFPKFFVVIATFVFDICGNVSDDKGGMQTSWCVFKQNIVFVLKYVFKTSYLWTQNCRLLE